MLYAQQIWLWQVVESKIPFDDTVIAMYKIGKSMPCELSETALGGLAVTPTGIELRNKFLENNIH